MKPAVEDRKEEQFNTYHRLIPTTIACQVNPPKHNARIRCLKKNDGQKGNRSIENRVRKKKKRISVTMTIKNYHRAKHSDVWE